jgi:pantoate--beta-alanine ligase
MRAHELHTEGEQDAEVLRVAMSEVLAAEPLAAAEYVSVADPETLEELELVGSEAMVSLAVRIGGARLIDHVMLA